MNKVIELKNKVRGHKEQSDYFSVKKEIKPEELKPEKLKIGEVKEKK